MGRECLEPLTDINIDSQCSYGEGPSFRKGPWDVIEVSVPGLEYVVRPWSAYRGWSCVLPCDPNFW